MDKNSGPILDFYKSFKQPEPEQFDRLWHSEEKLKSGGSIHEVVKAPTNASAIMNTCLALVNLALQQQMDQTSNSEAIFDTCAKWLSNFEFSLDEWNHARFLAFELLRVDPDKEKLQKFKIPNKLIPAKRNSILTCIYDSLKFVALIANMNASILIDPLDLRRFFMFSSESMRMSAFDLGASFMNRSVRRETENLKSEKTAEQPAPKPAPRQKKPKKTFAKVAKAGNFEKSEIKGTNTEVQLGVNPVKVGLHVKLLAGVKIEKFVSLLKSKRLKASNVKTAALSNGPEYSTHQVQLDVPISKRDSLSDGSFWPVGVYVRKWKGRLDRSRHELYHRRLELRGIGHGITRARIEQHLRSKIYNGVEFVDLVSSDVVDGKCTVDMKVRFESKEKLSLKKAVFPDKVKVKWLPTILKASGDWVLV